MPSDAPAAPAAVVLMGVAGSGKTTVGQQLADRLGWEFVDADDLHSASNRTRMRDGEGLTDADRAPWLEAVAAEMDRRLAAGRSVVIACSALRASHRERLASPGAPVRFVWLAVPEALLRERLVTREGHFAGLDLLDSQLATLEVGDPGVLRIDGGGPPHEVVEAVVRRLEPA